MKPFDYSQITLVPRVVSTLKSRSEADTSVVFAGEKLSVPLIASPMRDVCDLVPSREALTKSALHQQGGRPEKKDMKG